MDKTAYEIRIMQWINIIQEANTSGLAKRCWCGQNGISLRPFYYWQKKVRDYGLTAAIRHNYGMDQLEEGTLFLFCGTRKDQIKGLMLPVATQP